MGALKRLAPSLLLAAGLLVVFAGMTAALGFSVSGAIASVAVIGALLYAGGLWFGGPGTRFAPAGAETVIVFDRSLRVAAGPFPGTSLLLQFPDPLRPEIEMRCRLALHGEHTHFDCEHAGARISFDISPVQNVGSAVIYGALVTGGFATAPATAYKSATRAGAGRVSIGAQR
jgi:hypothetical protein